MLKKLLLVVTLLIVVLSLTLSAGAIEESYIEKFEGTTINVLDVSRDYHKVGYEFIIPMFEEKYGINVELEEVPFPNMREKTLMEMTSRTGRYDLISVDCMWLAEYVSAGYLEPLHRYINDPKLYDPEICNLNDFVPRALSGNGVYNDVLYTLPLSPGMSIMFIRQDLLDKHGLSIPNNREEFYDVAKTVDEAEEDVHGIVVQADKGMAFGHNWLDYLYSFGGEIFDEDWNCIIDSPESLEALEYYLSLKPFTPKGSATFGWDEVLTTFSQGKALMGAGYNPFMMYFENPETSKVAGDVSYARIPKGPAGRSALYGSWAMGISVDSSKKEAAWLFLQYLTGTEVAKEWAMKGKPPARHSIFKDPDVQEKWPWVPEVYKFMLENANPDFRPRIPEWAEVAEIIGRYGNQTWIGEISPEKALEKMEEDIQDVMEYGGYFDTGQTPPPQHWRNLEYYDTKPSNWQQIDLPEK